MLFSFWAGSNWNLINRKCSIKKPIYNTKGFSFPYVGVMGTAHLEHIVYHINHSSRERNKQKHFPEKWGNNSPIKIYRTYKSGSNLPIKIYRTQTIVRKRPKTSSWLIKAMKISQHKGLSVTCSKGIFILEMESKTLIHDH